MEERQILLTEDGYKKLEEELAFLKGTKKMQVAERIKIAREFGDISENSEYDEAKNEQALLESKIIEKENTLRLAKVVDDDEVSTRVVGVGAKIKVYDYELKEELEYCLVGAAEVDLDENKISNESPVGKALIGKKKNQDVFVETPGGTAKYKIISIVRQ
ncbi:MAG: transcription elongation factor GreA [Clostridia bacterium]|nr:transcription elongation factor GreA [Clostridia bacterium]MDD4386688.1 transcription elongation factor GreA [Clostridia bacterium]